MEAKKKGRIERREEGRREGRKEGRKGGIVCYPGILVLKYENNTKKRMYMAKVTLESL